MLWTLVVALMSAMAGMMSSAVAQETKHLAARVELHLINSLTISDQQFLTGDANGNAAQITGQLRIAQGSGRLPVVVLLHGSGGMGSNIEFWSKELNAAGISTFAIDGFTGRGITATNTNQALLGRLNFVLDVYRSLEILGKHPRVDPARIALMGFSRGGQGALYASATRFHKLWNKSGVDLAAYIPFYPDCSTTYANDADIADRPVRIFHGTPDDYNPVTSCKSFVERLKGAGKDIILTEYPNAQHAFDNPLIAGSSVVAKDNQTVRNCTLREEAAGVIINVANKEPFTYKDACVELNPHIGYDSQATAAAKQAVIEFLKTIFRLG
jgi:dienelactone hydrolase